MVKIILKGNPISVNSLYRGRRFLTNNGKALKEDYYYQIRSQYHDKPLATRLKLTIEAYFGSKRIRDIDNIGKVVGDSISGLVIVDDSLIDELHIYRRYDKNNPRVEMLIEELIV